MMPHLAGPYTHEPFPAPTMMCTQRGGSPGRSNYDEYSVVDLAGLTALLYGASGIMKVFMFDKVSKDVPSFGALPRRAWTALGILELVCTVGLIVPAALQWHPTLTVVAGTVLAIES